MKLIEYAQEKGKHFLSSKLYCMYLEVDDCLFVPVGMCNHGVCADGYLRHTCSCLPGWSGDVCDKGIR